jgi:hypothetical protein
MNKIDDEFDQLEKCYQLYFDLLPKPKITVHLEDQCKHLDTTYDSADYLL